MTPQFTTPCFVRIENAAKRKEVYEKLEELGYLKLDRNFIKLHKVIIARLLYVQTTMAFMDGRFINCGTNIDIFLALASMRSDTDKGQYFIDERDGSINFSEDEDIGLSALVFRRATAAEIVEHFKNK